MLEGNSCRDVLVAGRIGIIVLKMLGFNGFHDHCPLGALPDALRKATPSIPLAFKDMINLFKGQPFSLWVEEIHDWYERCIENSP